MGIGQIFVFTAAAYALLGCASGMGSGSAPINLIPMYGYPEVEKTERQKKADEQFIKSTVASAGSRAVASQQMYAWGRRYLQSGDIDNAMRRFNQAWLLDPEDYRPYWGFGSVLLVRRDLSAAVTHFDKAIELIDDPQDRPKLYTSAARTYSILAYGTENSPISESSYVRADQLFEEARGFDPAYPDLYNAWAHSYYSRGRYDDAWKMVKKSRELGKDFNPKFIEALSRRLAEPD